MDTLVSRLDFAQSIGKSKTYVCRLANAARLTPTLVYRVPNAPTYLYDADALRAAHHAHRQRAHLRRVELGHARFSSPEKKAWIRARQAEQLRARILARLATTQQRAA